MIFVRPIEAQHVSAQKRRVIARGGICRPFDKDVLVRALAVNLTREEVGVDRIRSMLSFSDDRVELAKAGEARTHEVRMEGHGSHAKWKIPGDKTIRLIAGIEVRIRNGIEKVAVRVDQANNAVNGRHRHATRAVIQWNQVRWTDVRGAPQTRRELGQVHHNLALGNLSVRVTIAAAPIQPDRNRDGFRRHDAKYSLRSQCAVDHRKSSPAAVPRE